MTVKTDDKVIYVRGESDDPPEVQAAKIIAAAIRESSGTDAGLRARALTAEREVKRLGDYGEERAQAADVLKYELQRAKNERDEARRQHHAACEQRDAAHERADRLQRDFDAAVALSERRQTLLEDGLHLPCDHTDEHGNKILILAHNTDSSRVIVGVRTASEGLMHTAYLPAADLAGLARGAQTEQPDTRPTPDRLRAIVVGYLKDFCITEEAAPQHAAAIVGRMVADFPGMVRPDDPAPTERDDAASEWAPGADITDRWRDAPVGLPIIVGLLCRRTDAGEWQGYEGDGNWIDVPESEVVVVGIGSAPFRVATLEDLAAAGIEVAK